ncbi:hypothetical protein L6452_33644 [Arctium lappa]|uniref:Uncharacterized protein n=1 Tax=Arctium lappa TaxID=4217 RepID=A0ACB8YH74_ARCLA|nr:hypothetical protein L6452_33644 [Arctium lappa]
MKYNDQQQQDPLQARLKTLEMEWDSIKQSISRSGRRNSATDSTATVTAVVENRLFRLHDNSPKELMSLLQHENSPPELDNGFSDDRAAIEVIDDRAVGFDTGRLTARRLFEGSEMGSDDGECLDVVGEHEVSTEFSYEGSENDDENCDQLSGLSRMGSLRSDGRKKGDVMVAVKHGGGGGGTSGGSVTRWMINMKTWIGVVIMMIALGIVAFKCKGEDELFLVPT